MNIVIKFYLYLASIPKDKILHYIVAYLIQDISLSILFHYTNINTWINLIISVLISSVFIFAKEAIDEKRYNGWDWKDIIAGYLGVITKTIVFIIYNL